MNLPLLCLGLLHFSLGVDLILRPNSPTCTVLVSSFDPVKVEVNLPSIGSKVNGQQFRLTLTNQMTGQVIQNRTVEDGKLLRENFYIEHKTVHELCFTFQTSRDLGDHSIVLVPFTAEEHFESMIGPVKVPPQLMNNEHLKKIFQVGMQMKEFVGSASDRQARERELEDRLVNLSAHKTQRIIGMTGLECLVIIASGVYQILALRNFLIDKNLY